MQRVALLLLVTFAAPVIAAPCAISGDAIHWIADYCMAKLETDDEIAASECINEEIARKPKDDCTAKRHYKRAMCDSAARRKSITTTIERCIADPTFMGSTVRNNGVGR